MGATIEGVDGWMVGEGGGGGILLSTCVGGFQPAIRECNLVVAAILRVKLLMELLPLNSSPPPCADKAGGLEYPF